MKCQVLFPLKKNMKKYSRLSSAAVVIGPSRVTVLASFLEIHTSIVNMSYFFQSYM